MSIYQIRLHHIVGRVLGLVLSVVVLGWVAGASAQTTTPGAAPAINATVAPYLDGDTTMVVHCDVSKLDVGAVDKFVVEIFDTLKVPAGDDMRTDFAAGRLAADGFIARFKQLGGRDIFGVMAMEDITHDINHVQFPVSFLLPVGAGGDAKGLIALFKATAGDAEGGPAMEMLKPDLIFVGDKLGLERLRAIKPVARPDLALGLSGGDAALEIVGALTADAKRVIREMMPALPAELSGGSTEFLTRDLGRASMEVRLSPEMSVKLSWAEANGPATAGEIGKRIAQLRDWMLGNADFQKGLKESTLSESAAAEVRVIVQEALTPKGNSLVLDGRQIRTLIVRLAERGAKAMAAATQISTKGAAGYIRHVLAVCVVYANENNQRLPESLDVLVKSGEISQKLLENPDDAKHRRFVYQALPGAWMQASLPIVWEEVDDPASPVYVGYADGHVELVKDHAALAAELKKAADWKANHK